jgi:hypothetical protein
LSHDRRGETQQENDMSKTNETTAILDATDITELGIASVETKGLIFGDEGVGGEAMPGISEE